MTVFSIAAPVAHLFSTLSPDDSVVSLLGLLLGMLGGWRLTGWHEQLRARRARIRRQNSRKTD